MSVTIKPILHSRKNKENKYPLAIRIYKDGKYSLVFLGFTMDKKQWDAKQNKVKKDYPNSGRLNAFITKKLAEINEKYLTLELENKETSSKILHKSIVNKASLDSFNAEAKEYLANLKNSGSYNRLSAERPRIHRFQEFIKGQDISFKEITISLLTQFKSFLLGGRKVSERTAINHLVVIRSIYSQAIKKGIVDQKHYPFGRGKVVIKFPDSIKVGLSKKEVESLEAFDAKDNEAMQLALDTWLLSFYFAGMRVADVLQLHLGDFKDGRLHYKMGKNDKVVSLQIPTKAIDIIKRYRPTSNERNGLLFPHLNNAIDLNDKFDVQKKTSQANKTINKNLKLIANEIGLNKNLTMHIARHTFGNISGDKIPIQMLQKLYRHSSILTTIGYQANFINKDMDDALNKVIS
jgi:site-specific recombinase XerD